MNYMDYRQISTADADAAVNAFIKKSRSRTRAVKIVVGCGAAPLALLLLLGVLITALGHESGMILVVFTASMLFILFYVARSSGDIFAARNQSESAKLLPGVAMELFGPYATFERERGISYAYLMESGFFPNGQQFKTADLVSGVRNGIPTAFSDAEVSHLSMDGLTINDFAGLWVMCRMPRPIDGFLRLTEGRGDLGGATGIAWFDARFGIEESAPGIASAILTPDFIESLGRIGRFSGGVLLVWVAGWDLHIAVDFHPNLFEGEVDGGSGGVSGRGRAKAARKKEVADYKAEYRREMERVALMVDEITRNAHLFAPQAATPAIPPPMGAPQTGMPQTGMPPMGVPATTPPIPPSQEPGGSYRLD
jgi:hypothetical protein